MKLAKVERVGLIHKILLSYLEYEFKIMSMSISYYKICIENNLFINIYHTNETIINHYLRCVNSMFLLIVAAAESMPTTPNNRVFEKFRSLRRWFADTDLNKHQFIDHSKGEWKRYNVLINKMRSDLYRW